MGTINYQSLAVMWLNIIKKQSQATPCKAEITSKVRETGLIEETPPRQPNVHSLDGLTDLLTKVR